MIQLSGKGRGYHYNFNKVAEQIPRYGPGQVIYPRLGQGSKNKYYLFFANFLIFYLIHMWGTYLQPLISILIWIASMYQYDTRPTKK